MSITTTSAIIGLKDETLDKLRELRRINVDSAKGFDECAEMVNDEIAKDAFVTIARHRRENATALGNQIAWNDKDESEPGSYVAALHRTWMKVRDAVTSDSLKAVLNEAERGEDVIKQAYEDALDDCKGSAVYPLLASQYESVKQVHDRIRDLRDAKNDCGSCS